MKRESPERHAQGELLTLAPTRYWHPAAIRLVGNRREGFDTTMILVEPRAEAPADRREAETP